MLPASSRAQPTLILPFEACLKVRAESFELSKTDSLPNLAHYVKVKVDVVMGVQDAHKRFASGIKVPQICTRVPAADGALTFFVYGPLIVCVPRVLDEQAALRSEQASMARAARGKNAIHHIDSEAYVIRKLFRLADAHQIARLICRQSRSCGLRHRAGGFVRLADCESTDCVAGKIESDKSVRIFAAQRFIRAALHDSEKRLPRRIAMLLEIIARASRPGECAPSGFASARFGGRRFDALIENHDDVRAQDYFNFERFLGR